MLLIWLLLISSAAAFDCRGACNLCDAMNKNSATAACTLCSECMKTQSRHVLNQIKPKSLRTGQQEEELEEDSQNCVTLSNCISPIENNSGKELIAENILTLQQPTASTQESTSTTPRQCPPIKPCKKLLDKLIDHYEPDTQSTLPRFLRDSIMRNIVTMNSDYEVDEQGCPTQPICSDEDEYDAQVTKRPLAFTTSTSTTTCRPKRLLKKRIRDTPKPTACMPCMPYCALPCNLSQAALEALITLKSLNNNVPNVDAIGKTEVMLTKGDAKELTEETTKEFMYFYVGIPKDVSNVERGRRKRY